MRSTLIVDVHNLYVGAGRKFPNKSVNYTELTKVFMETNNTLFQKIAYGRQPIEKVPSFAKMLQRLGYELVFENCPHNISMALKVAEIVDRRATDHLILGTSYYEAGKIIEYATKRGVYVTAFGFDLPKSFENIATTMFELDESYLQDRPNETTVTPLVPANVLSDSAQLAT